MCKHVSNKESNIPSRSVDIFDVHVRFQTPFGDGGGRRRRGEGLGGDLL